MRPLQMVCSTQCAFDYKRQKKQKDWNKEKKVRKKELMTHSDYVKIAQAIVNKFVRIRDKNQPCITCGKEPPYTISAGHFFAAGTFPRVRLDIENIHGQCWWNCNKNKHGSFAEYEKNLPNKIGQDKVDALKIRAHQGGPLKLSIPELQEFTEGCKELIKGMEDEGR